MIQYMTTRANNRRCLLCREPIIPGEPWIKQTSIDDAYNVAFHVRCWNALCQKHREAVRGRITGR